MYILGISAFYHDSAAVLISDGEIVAAGQEEWFTRIKHDPSFPIQAIEYCLRHAHIGIDDVQFVSYYEKPFLKFERLLETYIQFAPRGITTFVEAMPLWLKQKIWLKDIIVKELKYEGQILFTSHHESHAASAFFPSPFEKAAILTIDGVGEWETASIGIGEKNNIHLISSLNFPHSLGLLYSAFTAYLGFKVNFDEYKIMGLAPYGEPKFTNLILQELIDLKRDGSFKLNMNYFDYCTGQRMINVEFAKLFKLPVRTPEAKLTQNHMDIASSIQKITEEIMLRMVHYVYKETKQKKLCLAGGVTLNCVANGKILREGPFEDIWIQPAAGDAGGALGAAYLIWHQYLSKKRKKKNHDSMNGSLLGPKFSDEEIKTFLDKEQIFYEKLTARNIPEKIADLLAQGAVIGWFQGRMEYGPRALGSRSILGDARSPYMQKKLNLKIKFRESFRPFAPAVLKEKVSEYFELDKESPYMLLVAQVKKKLRIKLTHAQKKKVGLEKLNIKRSVIPAVTHVDYSARIQTVDGRYNLLFYDLIKKFEKKYKCAVIINTSFNIQGEPIVCAPTDAYQCFMNTGMDYLLLGSFFLDKKRQIGERLQQKIEMSKTSHEIIREMRKIKDDTQTLKKFGILMGSILVLYGGVLLLRGKSWLQPILSLGLLFYFFTIISPRSLMIIHKVWMSLAIIIGWVMSRMILVVLYLIVFPVFHFLAKATNQRLLSLSVDKTVTSYWIERVVKSDAVIDYQRQY